MRGARIAVDTAMLASTIRIEAVAETDLRTIVFCKDGAGVINIEFRQDIPFRLRILEVLRQILKRSTGGKRLESVQRIGGSPASVHHWRLHPFLTT
jgi:hypothetical protein